MTDIRNPGILRVSESRYRAIQRFTGAFTIVVGALLIAGAIGCLVIGPPFLAVAAALALLAVGAIAAGVLTLVIAARFPFVERFARAVVGVTVAAVVLGLGGALLVALLSPDGIGLGIAALLALFTLVIAMLANASRLVIRTGAALIAPPS